MPGPPPPPSAEGPPAPEGPIGSALPKPELVARVPGGGVSVPLLAAVLRAAHRAADLQRIPIATARRRCAAPESRFPSAAATVTPDPEAIDTGIGDDVELPAKMKALPMPRVARAPCGSSSSMASEPAEDEEAGEPDLD